MTYSISYSHVCHLPNCRSKEGNCVSVCVSVYTCTCVGSVVGCGVGQCEGYEVALGAVWDMSVWGDVGDVGGMGFAGWCVVVWK